MGGTTCWNGIVVGGGPGGSGGGPGGNGGASIGRSTYRFN